MKVIRLYDDAAPLGDGLLCRHTRLYADSAVGRDSQPLFLPAFDAPLRGRLCPAFRIERLGKHIAPKFASRYFDAVGVVLVLDIDPGTPDGAAMLSCGADALIDGMVTTGSWLSFDAGSAWTMGWGDISATFSFDSLGLGAALSQISRLTTVKSGDLLVIDYIGIDVPVERDTYVRASLDGQECLCVKVK